MQIIRQTLSIQGLSAMAADTFGNLVKAVVDVDKEIFAVDAELHSDLEALLLQDGSGQKSLWGINLYPEKQDDDFIEFDSLINIRPSVNNTSRGVENQETRKRICAIITKSIKR